MQSGNKGGFRGVVAWIGGSKPPPYDMQEIRMDKAVFRRHEGIIRRGGNLPPADERRECGKINLYLQNFGSIVGDGALDVPQTSAENWDLFVMFAPMSLPLEGKCHRR